MRVAITRRDVTSRRGPARGRALEVRVRNEEATVRCAGARRSRFDGAAARFPGRSEVLEWHPQRTARTCARARGAELPEIDGALVRRQEVHEPLVVRFRHAEQLQHGAVVPARRAQPETDELTQVVARDVAPGSNGWMWPQNV